ncbi:hypothetical protein JVT61DRAFT_294 [Boletus reticuloceps]|uniref:TPR-like protein n=1 Tax=Boletus reticuloceps TaxID=495285 RepID=A0A8I3AFM9_9AGAM|nr:hypothetical protein JVT61DRAFT_294 [Boletus reticuloceps]
MHVKKQVKEFVHDVKRKFSKKHKRDSCSTFDSYDDSSADTLSHLDDSSSSSGSSQHSTTSRFIKFIRHRSTSNKHNGYHNARSEDGRRHRIFSAPTVPNHKQPVSYQGPGSFESSRGMRETYASSQDYSDVIDVSARVSSGSAATLAMKSTSSSSRAVDGDSLSQSQPQFDRDSSDTSATLVTSTSGKRSASESDSRIFSDSHSDESSEKVRDSVALATSAPPSIDPMADVPPVFSSPREEEITLARSVSSSPSRSPPVPQAPRIATPAQPIRSTSASPAPVYIPRLTAPSMFLPIPNTDPLNALLTKYVPTEQRPRRDVVGEYAGRDVHEMVMSNSWRALAKMARDRIVASDPEDLGRILDLWSLRLSSLARLRLTNQASAECTNLFAVLNAVHATSIPGTFPGSALPPSTPLPPSPASAAHSPLSPSGLSGLVQLPGTPSQKPSALPSSLATPATAPRQGMHELVHPFELTVFHARVHYWSGDPLGYVDALSRILRRCKERAREEGRIVMQRREVAKMANARGEGETEGTSESEQASESEDANEDKDGDGDGNSNETECGGGEGDEGEEDAEESTENTEVQDEEKEVPDDVLAAAEANLSMWLERIARTCLILASQMIEMNDYQAAINLLTPLCTNRATPTFQPTPTPQLHSALARVYLLSGNLQKAEEHFSIAVSAAANSANGTDIIAMNTALLAAASGDWTRAEEALSEMVTKDPGNFTAINNLAVTLLCQGRIKEGIDLLEAALKTSPSSVVVTEPFLFNLSTLYELRSTAAIDKKRGLLIEVAKWSGDGLKTSCLKMPAS